MGAYLFTLAGFAVLISSILIWMPVWRQEVGKDQPATLYLLIFAMLIIVSGMFTMRQAGDGMISMRLLDAVTSLSFMVLFIYTIGFVRHQVQGIGLFLLPITALPLMILPWVGAANEVIIHSRSPLEVGHIVVSLFAYALLTLAAVHAVMHLLLNRALKQKNIKGLSQHLPALVDIERHMMAQVRLSSWLLAIVIVSGMVWQWNTQASIDLLHHKMLLSIIAWITLCFMTFFRKRGTLAGKRASQIVLASYILLLLAYFGVRIIQAWVH